MKRGCSRSRPASQYREIDHRHGEEHPIDAAVERRLPQKKLRRRIRKTIDRVMEGLGDERRLWFRLEDLQGVYHSRREETYFDVGYEQGLAAGWAEAMWVRGVPCITASHTDEARILTRRIRDIAVQADLAPPLTLSAILEAARAIALDHGDPRQPGEALTPRFHKR
jgi:hypothetical protein